MEFNENKEHSPMGKEGHVGFLDEKTFSKYFLLIVFILSLLAFISVIKVFIILIVLAAVFATLFFPFYAWLLKVFNNRKSISAFVTCVLILLGLLVPIIIISNLVVVQGFELYRTAEPQMREIIQKGDAGVLGKLQGLPFYEQLAAINLDWHTILNNAMKMLGVTAAKLLNKTSRATVEIVIDLFIILFSIFFFLRDGQRILLKVRNAIPLSEQYKDLIVERFSAISRATVKGTLLIALIQSFLGTITLWAFGIQSWLLWGVVMLVFAVIPFVGTGAVLIPAGIISIIKGDVWQGVTIIMISVFFISLIDNFLRPKLVGRDTGMHMLLVFFSSLGGIGLFGPAGFIIGPLIAAIFLTILDIYSIEFQKHIEYPNK